MGATTALAEGGMVAAKLPGYEVRPQQLAMADAVRAAFDNHEHLIVEAGTGVGKSFAYLIPAIERVTREGGRVVVSTHTIALQEQLIHKDIPFLRGVFEEEFSAVLVKGRSNYLGLRRLQRASRKQELLFDTRGQRSSLAGIEDWAYETTDGSLGDLSSQPQPAVWDRVRSDLDDCLGRRCPHYQKCFYQRARRRAMSAQILVVNHAMLFSDLALRRQGASVLPDYEFVILDEAHTVERVAGDHMGLSTSDAQARHLFNTLYNERTGRGVLSSKLGRPLRPAVDEARGVVEDYFASLLTWYEGQRGWNGRLREPPAIEQRVRGALVDLADRLLSLGEEITSEEDRMEVEALRERCKGLGVAVEHWHEQQSEGWVYWMTVAQRAGGRVTLNARPIDVGPELKESLFDRVKSAVLTSATLTTRAVRTGDAAGKPIGRRRVESGSTQASTPLPADAAARSSAASASHGSAGASPSPSAGRSGRGASDPFKYIRGRIGLDDVTSMALGSPFDFREQLRVYVEAGLPDPGDGAAYTAAACESIKRYTRQSGGRAFVLFTSYAMMERFAGSLSAFFLQEEMPLLVQGSGMPRTRMLDAFRSTPRSVLFGTDTFWTGVDVPGDALSNVIIVKLPFAVPNEPMVEARIERIRAEGGNPFIAYQVPEAVLKFRQGIGRLIRSRSDRGIVVVLDPRVRTKPYGRRFLEALPDCEVVVNTSEE